MRTSPEAPRTCAARRAKRWLTFLVLVFPLLTALAGPSLAPYRIAPCRESVSERLLPPSLLHPFGTDEMGQDLLSRILLVSRRTLAISLLSAAVAVSAGLASATVTVLLPPAAASALERTLDIFLAFPFLILAILFSTASSLDPDSTMVLCLSLAMWAGCARILTARLRTTMSRQYVQASRVMGAGNLHIVFRHLLPDALPLTIVLLTLRSGMALLAQASLEFLGIASNPSMPGWGAMVNMARDYFELAPWYALAPAGVITLYVFMFNLGGDLLAELLDPTLRNP